MPGGRRGILALLLGVAVYAGLVVWADGAAVWEALRGVAPGAVLRVLAWVSLGFVLRAWRFSLFLSRLDVEVGAGAALRIFCAGMSMGVTPGKLGEVLKSFLLRNERGVPVARTASIVVLERVGDVVALLVLLLLGGRGRPFGWVEATSALGVAALLLPFVAPGPWLGLLERAPAGRLGRAATSLGTALRSGSRLATPGLLVGTSALAVVAWGLEGLALEELVEALGGALPYTDAARIYAAATLAGAVTMLPGGVGASEGSMALLLTRRGLAAPTAAAATLLLRLCTLWYGVAVGVGALWMGPEGVAETLEELEEAE